VFGKQELKNNIEIGVFSVRLGPALIASLVLKTQTTCGYASGLRSSPAHMSTQDQLKGC